MKRLVCNISMLFAALMVGACTEKEAVTVPPPDQEVSDPIGPENPTFPSDPSEGLSYEIGSVVDGGVLYKVEGITGYVLYPYAMEPSVWTTQSSGRRIKEQYRISSSMNDGQANVAQMKERSADLSAYPPAKYCDDIEGDWYLPSNDECAALFAAYHGVSEAEYVSIPQSVPDESEQKYKDARSAFDAYILACAEDGHVLNSAPGTESGDRSWTSTVTSNTGSDPGKARAFSWGTRASVAKEVDIKYYTRCIKQVNLSGKKEEGSVQFAGEEGEYDVYLLIGQSNMAGRGEMTQADKAVIPNVYILDSEGNPVPAANPMNIYSSIRKEDALQAMGLGASFARTVAGQTGRKVLLVVNARGDSSINDWRKGLMSYVRVGDSSDYVTLSYYEEALRRVRQAMRYGALKGILWHQGCSDQNDDRYMTILTYMVNDFRKDLGADVPFIAGQLGGWRSSASGFNERMTRIDKYLIWSDWVSSEGCQPIVTAASDGKPDKNNPHFDRESQILLGERYAQKILEIVYGR